MNLNPDRAFILMRRSIVAAVILFAVVIVVHATDSPTLEPVVAWGFWLAVTFAERYHAWSQGYRAGRSERR